MQNIGHRTFFFLLRARLSWTHRKNQSESHKGMKTFMHQAAEITMQIKFSKYIIIQTLFFSNSICLYKNRVDAETGDASSHKPSEMTRIGKNCIYFGPGQAASLKPVAGLLGTSLPPRRRRRCGSGRRPPG